MAMVTTTYEMEAMIRGYHVYATVWLNTFFLTLLVPVRTLDVTVQLSAGLDRPARYGRALVGVGNFRGIIFAEAVVSEKTAKFKSHEI